MLDAMGMLATLIIFFSFTFTDIKLIRWLNVVGSVFFVIYGFGVGATWTGVLNAGLILVNLYHLYKLYSGKKNPKSKKRKK